MAWDWFLALAFLPGLWGKNEIMEKVQRNFPGWTKIEQTGCLARVRSRVAIWRICTPQIQGSETGETGNGDPGSQHPLV